ncbi:isochorismatase family protein [Aquicoccus sp. G2-2]|uniref:isochorismatase family protein n=1 Tax=Aquicoccus sp. G2-2 TaxID=3092120 RepID=UPI002AE06324|nr:isochorismatase family protein [Aquicoccus sp. G2-2]MEA1113934.1 isochorismatase family protein [Aquicoccus sp. G2-2]
MSQEKIYMDAGFGARVPRGPHPALIVVDFSYGFTDAAYPTASEAGPQIAATNRLIALAREKNVPVIFTVIAFNKAELKILPWLKKATGMKTLEEGSRLVEVDGRLDRVPDDPVVVKKGASAFFGTNLAAQLSGAGVDTVVLTGATTSGCVRASAVDAVQSGFNVLVAGDACADRARPPHDAALYDIAQKYGDVIETDEAAAYFSAL